MCIHCKEVMAAGRTSSGPEGASGHMDPRALDHLSYLYARSVERPSDGETRVIIDTIRAGTGSRAQSPEEFFRAKRGRPREEFFRALKRGRPRKCCRRNLIAKPPNPSTSLGDSSPRTGYDPPRPSLGDGAVQQSWVINR